MNPPSPSGRASAEHSSDDVVVRATGLTKVFKDFCTERQVMVKDFLADFKSRGAYLGEQKKRMGKGTNIDSPAVRVYEFSYTGEDFYGVEGALAESR
jgi:hypothetical protein